MNILSFLKWNSICINPIEMFKLKSGFLKGDINLSMRNGLKLTLMNRGEHSDTAVVSDIYFNKPYIYDGLNIKDGWNIGANVGIFSTWISKEANNLNIYAYEPAKDNFKYLNKNIINNKLNKLVKTFNFAVSDKSGKTVSLFLNEFGSGGNSLYKETISSKLPPVKIKTISLSDILKTNKLNHVDLIKIDCEGAEYEIVMKTPWPILNKIDRFVIETHKINKYTDKQLESFLIKSGFNVFRNTHNILCAERIK